MVFAALVMIRAEILWFFSHVGVTVGKTKGARVMPIEMVIIYLPTCGLCSFNVRDGSFRQWRMAVFNSNPQVLRM